AGFLYKIAKQVPFINAAFSTIAATFGRLVVSGAALTGLAGLKGLPLLMTGLGLGFKVLGFAIRFIVAPLMVLVGVFQLISRVLGYAKINDAKALADKSGALSDTFGRLGKAFTLFMKP